MMPKINIDKTNSFDPIRTERQADVKPAGHTPVRPERADAASKDRVNVSGKAAEVAELTARVKDLPEVRADKVNEIRAKMESGSFKPSADEIAEAIINDESR